MFIVDGTKLRLSRGDDAYLYVGASLAAGETLELRVYTDSSLGTLLFSLAAGFLLPLGAKDAAAASAGLGWYSLAPTLLAPYSLSLSAVAFLSNVMREILSIVAIPFVARYVGYLECVALPGAAAMDTVLPVVIGATHERITIYSFASGVVLSLLVPILVPLIIALPF